MVGTGTGKVLIALKNRYEEAMYYGIDTCKETMAKIDSSHGFNLSVMNVELHHDFKDEDFDLVTTRMALHHAGKKWGKIT